MQFPSLEKLLNVGNQKKKPPAWKHVPFTNKPIIQEEPIPKKPAAIKRSTPKQAWGEMKIEELGPERIQTVPKLVPSNETKDLWETKDNGWVGRPLTMSDLAHSPTSDWDDQVAELLKDMSNFATSKKGMTPERLAGLEQRYNDILHRTKSQSQSQSIDRLQDRINQIRIAHHLDKQIVNQSTKGTKRRRNPSSPPKGTKHRRTQSSPKGKGKGQKRTRSSSASDIESRTRDPNRSISSNGSLHLSDLST